MSQFQTAANRLRHEIATKRANIHRQQAQLTAGGHAGALKAHITTAQNAIEARQQSIARMERNRKRPPSQERKSYDQKV